jgi:RNA polymerase sigma factor (TIGR02999 family)
MSDVTRLIDAAAAGDKQAAADLFPLVYDELRKLAAARMAQEGPGQTLDATALVHEAYLRLTPGGAGWDGRGHFFAAAAEVMRRILIDRARERRSRKRGGDRRRVEMDVGAVITDPEDSAADDLLALDQALTELEREHPAKARLVTLRYFAGLSIQQSADALGISPATAKRHWIYARSWLYGKLHGE